MCGIAGLVDQSRSITDVEKMLGAIVHRGPDAGKARELSDGVIFGHRRLSIIDLSESGAQPMVSHNQRWILTYNGEIYNFQELKKDLQRNWRGHSDTEILLEAFAEWGVEKTLARIKGMFAMALFDSKDRKLFLIRDRVGEKPLYYGHVGKSFVFASELKAIAQLPGFTGRISTEALAGFFSFSCVPNELSIYEGISKLLPGNFLELDLTSGKKTVKPYWSIENFKNKLEIEENEAIDRLEMLLENAVQSQMMADVPLGAFLSGGVDSSTIVAFMQKTSTRKVKTFSIGFHDASFNEAEYAKAVAIHLGTDHTELYVTARDALDVVPLLPSIYDEPFADSSQIPTYLLSKMTSQHVKVSLSGDAGDELFGGYNRYRIGPKIKRFNEVFPSGLGRLASGTLGVMPDFIWKNMKGIGKDRIFKMRRILGQKGEAEIYDSLVRHWGPEHWILNKEINSPKANYTSSGSFAESMMRTDLLTYLPDDILVKVDRAAMSVSLETRVPLLDRDIVEFALQLPENYKLRGQTKYLLRQVLYRHVPKELIERPKMGFSIPVEHWLKKELKDWAEDLLSESKLSHGLLNKDVIRNIWNSHQKGEGNWQHYIWDVLMFQAWYHHKRF